jgi:uncharacterized membrane protein YkvA (DUF1232 family)
MKRGEKSVGKRTTERADKARESDSYKKAKTKAEEYANDPEKLNDLLGRASKKARGKEGPLGVLWNQLQTCIRLLKAYADGTYREVPWQTLVMLVASIVYFVMPIDLIPDVVVGLGMLDDVAVLGWTLRAFSSDIDAFAEWEARSSA